MRRQLFREILVQRIALAKILDVVRRIQIRSFTDFCDRRCGQRHPGIQQAWRENIPFAAGILQENDVEYKAAVALASEVVAEKAFYPVGQDKVQAAKRLIDSCKKCICAVEEFGPLNEANRELAEYARRIGKTGKNI